MTMVNPSLGMVVESVPPANQRWIQSAGQKFDFYLTKDKTYPELSHLLGVTSSGTVYCSIKGRLTSHLNGFLYETSFKVLIGQPLLVDLK